MLYDNDGALYNYHSDERFTELSNMLTNSVDSLHRSSAGTPAMERALSSKEKKWQFNFSDPDNGRVDLRSWYLVRRTMALLSEVRGRDTNILLGILLVMNFIALLVPIVISVHFGFEQAFDTHIGAQILYDTLILVVLTVLIFRQGQVANDRQARDKAKLTFTHNTIMSDLSCSKEFRNLHDNALNHRGQHLELLAAALRSIISCMDAKDAPLTLLGFPLTFKSLTVFSGGIASFFVTVLGTQMPSHFLGCR